MICPKGAALSNAKNALVFSLIKAKLENPVFALLVKPNCFIVVGVVGKF